MIVNTNIQGSVQPLNFSIQVQQESNKRWTAYDKTKLDQVFLRHFKNIKELNQVQLSQAGDIFCLGSVKGGVVQGNFIGELIVALNETIPQLLFVEGVLQGELIDSTFSLKLFGDVFNNHENLGKITGLITLNTDLSNILSATSLINLTYTDWERALLSPTTAAVSKSKYHTKESTNTLSYWWRESIDKQLLIFRDELLSDRASNVYTNASPQAIKNNLMTLIDRTSVNITSKDFKKVWNGYLALIHYGCVDWGYEQALSNFSLQAPIVKTIEDNSLIVGNAIVGTSKVGGDSLKNTLLVDYSNTRLTSDISVVSWFLRKTRQFHMKTIIKTSSESQVIL